MSTGGKKRPKDIRTNRVVVDARPAPRTTERVRRSVRPIGPRAPQRVVATRCVWLAPADRRRLRTERTAPSLCAVRLPLVARRRVPRVRCRRAPRVGSRAMEERGAAPRACLARWDKRALTGGNLRAAFSHACRVRYARCRGESSRTSRRSLAPDGFSKTSAPALALVPRARVLSARRAMSRETLRSLDQVAPPPRTAQSVRARCGATGVPLCRSPRKRGGGPRVLGRAARLIEGPHKAHMRRTREDESSLAQVVEMELPRSGKNVQTITLNGGSLGSWVDEERS